MTTAAEYERPVDILARLYQRRKDLFALCGESGYKETMKHALRALRAEMKRSGDTNPFSVALAFAKSIPDDGGGGGSQTQQFILVAALELMEGNES